MDDVIKGILIAVASGFILTGIPFCFRWYNDTLKRKRKILFKTWTNEGDFFREEEIFIEMSLEERHGDILGALKSPQITKELEVSINKVGFFSTYLEIFDLRGRKLIPVAKVKVKIIGNKNNLSWKTLKDYNVYPIPKNTKLWLKFDF